MTQFTATTFTPQSLYCHLQDACCSSVRVYSHANSYDHGYVMDKVIRRCLSIFSCL